MGVSVALYGQLTFKNGEAQQTNFDGFELARLTDAPRAIDVIVVDSDQPPGGVGEPGLPPFAPALCNAIYAATGQRIRRLRLAPSSKPKAGRSRFQFLHCRGSRLGIRYGWHTGT